MAKAGRKGYEYELQQKELWNLSARTLLSALKSNKVKPPEKRRIALELVKKMMPSNFNFKSESLEKVVKADFSNMSKDQLREFLRTELSKE